MSLQGKEWMSVCFALLFVCTLALQYGTSVRLLTHTSSVAITHACCDVLQHVTCQRNCRCIMADSSTYDCCCCDVGNADIIASCNIYYIAYIVWIVLHAP